MQKDFLKINSQLPQEAIKSLQQQQKKNMTHDRLSENIFSTVS